MVDDRLINMGRIKITGTGLTENEKKYASGLIREDDTDQTL